METPNSHSQTQEGDMEAIQVPSISALLADHSIDHTGGPIPVSYERKRTFTPEESEGAPVKSKATPVREDLWRTKASANRSELGYLSEADLLAIHCVIGPAAAAWEAEHGRIYTNSPGPIDDGHEGLQGSKIVPVRLNLDGESIRSIAGERALMDHDFVAILPTGLPDGDRPEDLVRWRLYDSHRRPKKPYPSYYIVWQDPNSEHLYARIPKPPEGMGRAFCDHCWIHDPDRVEEYVEYFDDRSHVDEFREMSAGDTAITPFSLCWFHWWYNWSGELLRRSQVHALELLVSDDLGDRWGISHMREFLLFMKARFSTAEGLREDDLRGRRDPGPGPTRGASLNTVGSAVVGELEGSNLSNLDEETVASRDPHQMAAGGQPANATTADGPNGARASGQSTVAPASPDLMILDRSARSYDIKSRIEEAAARPGKVRDRRQVARPLLFDNPMKASRRRGEPLPIATSYFDGVAPPIRAQDGNRLVVQGNNGDSQPVSGSDASQSATNSTPAPDFPHNDTIGPAEPPRTNRQSTPSRCRALTAVTGVNGNLTSQAIGLVPTSTVAPGPNPQTNSTPVPREDGFLRSPPKEPRSMRSQAEAGNQRATRSVRLGRFPTSSPTKRYEQRCQEGLKGTVL